MVESMVYEASDIQKMLGLGRSKTYAYLEEVAKKDNPEFRVIKVGKLVRVPKASFDAFMSGVTYGG